MTRPETRIYRTLRQRAGAGILTLAAALLLTALAPAMAQQTQSLQSIREKVESYVRAAQPNLGPDARVEVGRLDRRLRLAACDAPLEAFPPYGRPGPGNTTVGVRCNGSRPWTIYVPVSVHSYVHALTLAAPLPRGAVLKESDLVPIRRDIAALPHGYYTEPAELAGMELRRPLRAGEILTPNTVTPPKLVQRGQRVTIVAAGGSVRITSRGTALQDGAHGQLIRVQNSSSRRVVQARVVERDLVQVGF